MPVYTERAAGTYRAKYLGCADKTLTDKDSGEEVVRWLWRFQELSDPTTAGEISKFTGTSMQSPNSNAYRMAAGILGHKPQPGDDTEKHVGDVYDVTYGPNQAGNLAIILVTAVKDQSVATTTNPAAAPKAPMHEGMEQDEPSTPPKSLLARIDAHAAESDDLPF